MADDDTPRDPLDMTGRTVIVTGGTKGLGRAITERFLQQGADVVICARREPETPVDAGGRSAMFVACDVREPEQIATVVAAAVDTTGRVDVLVNNAGGAPPADSATASPRFNEKIVALNLLAPLNFAQAVHDQMQSQDDGGVIINIASVSGTRANPAGVAYGAAKAGLINATETLAVEWGPKIRVIAPVVGLIVTEEAHLFYGDEAGIAAVGETLALGRMGVPEEIADVVLFCASPLARWVSGCTIHVHGGGDKPSYLGASTGEVAKTS
jgi:NAD(P)-dependent dehydrogenase (short-subunit alcohol dehydrogenase family)